MDKKSKKEFLSLFRKTNTILFDKDGTILDFKFLWINWCYKIINEASIIIPPSEMKKKLKIWGVDLDYGHVKPTGLLAIGSVDELKKTLSRQMMVDTSIKAKKNFNSKEEASEFVNNIIEKANKAAEVGSWIKPVRGVPKAIKELYIEGYKLGLVTTDDTQEAVKHLEVIGLKKYFHTILGCDLVDNCKPSPDLVFKACHLMKVEPFRTVVIGDTVADMVMGKKAGVGCCMGVTSGVTPKESLSKAADIVLSTAGELPGYILKV